MILTRTITSLVAFAFFLSLVSCGKETRRKIQTKNLMLGRKLAIACAAFEQENGQLPPSLSGLVTSGFMTQEELDSTRYIDPRSNELLEWSYNSELGEYGALLSSPVIVDKSMVIILRNGLGKITTMDELAR